MGFTTSFRMGQLLRYAFSPPALTVVAMLFMPATLIAGIFGMNFSYMPWIHDHQGFWWAISLMAAIALLMLMIFWRRQWLSSQTQL